MGNNCGKVIGNNTAVYIVIIILFVRGEQSVSTDGRSVNPSLTDSRIAGELTTDGNIEQDQDNTLHAFMCDRAASYVI